MVFLILAIALGGAFLLISTNLKYYIAIALVTLMFFKLEQYLIAGGFILMLVLIGIVLKEITQIKGLMLFSLEEGEDEC